MASQAQGGFGGGGLPRCDEPFRKPVNTQPQELAFIGEL